MGKWFSSLKATASTSSLTFCRSHGSSTSLQVLMAESSKQPHDPGVSNTPVTMDPQTPVLTDITNAAPSHSLGASHKSSASTTTPHSCSHAQSMTSSLLVTGVDSPIPAHLASLGNTTEEPIEVGDSSDKTASPAPDHHMSDSSSSSSGSSHSIDSDSGSTSSGSGFYSSESASTIITSGSSHTSDSDSPSDSPMYQM